ncbi:MAG TPA: glycogen-binding domain-containing protein [Polyangia bacterium]|nr:glycogen-binding domain-containing protein [Polyangia bacterium]
MRQHARDTDAEVVEGIVEELASLREVATPPAMVARVMTSVADRPVPDLLAWLHRPMRIVVRVSPIGILALVAGVALAAAMLLSSRSYPIPMSIEAREPATLRPSRAGGEITARPGAVRVRFALRAPMARRVAVAGSFNGWSQTETILTDDTGRGLYAGTVALPPGEHEYMFVVDGKFVTDPDAVEQRPDGFGMTNALLRIN